MTSENLSHAFFCDAFTSIYFLFSSLTAPGHYKQILHFHGNNNVWV